jgi:hypothetical protein
VVNPAYGRCSKSNYNQIKTTSLIAGFLLPLAILFIIRILDTKIRTKEDLESVAPYIPIGEIPYNDTDKTLIEKNDFTILPNHSEY